MLVFEERGKLEFNPHMTPGLGIEPGTHLVEGELSHHCANPAPQVLHVYDE